MFRAILQAMVRITDLARITGASADELRYLERKGFVNPARKKLKLRKVREYQDADTRKLKLIIKYRRQGFTWDAAFERAMRELESPLLFDYG